MGSGGSSSQGSVQVPGTLSPVTATLLNLFGTNLETAGGQIQTVPYQTFGQGGAFTPQSFSALPGLLANMPATATEKALTSPQFQELGLSNALASQGLLGAAGTALQDLLKGPEAEIALARRQFSQETLPAILERTPGFSSSDLQREVTRAGADLEAQIAAMRESSKAQSISLAPQIAQAVGTNLLETASQQLGYGQLARDFLREQSPAGDAFRVLTALQSLTTPAITGYGTSSGKSKNLGILS